MLSPLVPSGTAESSSSLLRRSKPGYQNVVDPRDSRNEPILYPEYGRLLQLTTGGGDTLSESFLNSVGEGGSRRLTRDLETRGTIQFAVCFSLVL